MEALFNALIAAAVVSLISLIGVFTLALKHKTLDKIIILLIALSAGTLLGGAFLHLIPESIEEFGTESTIFSLLIGFCAFFLIERVLFWHHCHMHGGECQVHTFTYMNLIGDALHNFLDGIIIAASFLVSFPVGIATTVAVIAHEIPQEIGDFGVLIYGGFSKTKALLYNFASALMAVLGVLVGYYLSSSVEVFHPFLVPFAAGGFIYIGASDLIPQLHKEPKISKSIQSFSVFIFGLLLMFALKIILESQF